MNASRALRHGPLALLFAASACAPVAEAPVRVAAEGTSVEALEAFCSVNVQGTGVIDVEADYLPHVVACENGAADDEALRAQAVAARSYLYYKLATGDGTITDGQGDQVYTCGTAPGPEHYEAVASTAGEVLLYEGSYVAAFYVAGAIPSETSCLPSPGDNDWSDTERFVTYNWGRAGAGLEQSSLGWIDPDNVANRGCQSQNGANCLSLAGWSYEEILRFYYGMDIEHRVATGTCAAPTGLPHGCGLIADEGDLVVDDSSRCFLRGCGAADGFTSTSAGVEGGALLTPGQASGGQSCFGRWELSFAREGDYELEVHIPDVGERVSEAAYLVRHGGAETAVLLDLSHSEGWVSLGAFPFDVGSFQYVELSDAAPESGDATSGPFVVYDAVRVHPAGADLDAGPASDGGVDDAEPVEPLDGGDGDARPLPPSVVDCACASLPDVAPVGLGALPLLGLALRRRRRLP